MAGAIGDAPISIGKVHFAGRCLRSSENGNPECIRFSKLRGAWYRARSTYEFSMHVPGVRRGLCCSRASDNETPKFIKSAVSGITEILRFFSSDSSSSNERLIQEGSMSKEITVSSIDDVALVLEEDYANAYFVTGTELYERNLKLLVPFFDRQSIRLQKIEKGVESEANYVKATWALRTYLKLPWRPFISVNGTTVYELDSCFKIVRHSESWDISALEAIIQIFTPSFGRPHDES